MNVKYKFRITKHPQLVLENGKMSYFYYKIVYYDNKKWVETYEKYGSIESAEDAIKRYKETGKFYRQYDWNQKEPLIAKKVK
jgi:hypothetical protein